MAKSKVKEIPWLDQPEEHNYTAAKSYLSLLHPLELVAGMVDRLQEAPVVQASSQGDPLADSFSHVREPGPVVDPGGPVPSPDAPDSRAL